MPANSTSSDSDKGVMKQLHFKSPLPAPPLPQSVVTLVAAVTTTSSTTTTMH